MPEHGIAGNDSRSHREATELPLSPAMTVRMMCSLTGSMQAYDLGKGATDPEPAGTGCGDP